MIFKKKKVQSMQPTVKQYGHTVTALAHGQELYMLLTFLELTKLTHTPLFFFLLFVCLFVNASRKFAKTHNKTYQPAIVAGKGSGVIVILDMDGNELSSVTVDSSKEFRSITVGKINPANSKLLFFFGFVWFFVFCVCKIKK